MSASEKINVIMAVHNEEKYLPKTLECLKHEYVKLIVVLDRCTDNSQSIIMNFFPDAIIIIKNEKKWENSYSENLQLGFEQSDGKYIAILDADVACPQNTFDQLLQELTPSMASISADVVTDRTASLMNILYYYWSKTYKIGKKEREPRGAVRVILRHSVQPVGGFKDVTTPDTQLDLDLRQIGYESRISKYVVCTHLRHFSFKKSIQSQIVSGKMRRKMNMPIMRVIGHSIIRLRPFVLYGYLIS